MPFFIGVHIGAGYHSHEKSRIYKQVLKDACKSASSSLILGKSALEAVTVAISFLEDCPLTNAGLGSNLNEIGNVECDASIMDGCDSLFGAIGAVSGVKNPICLASKILAEQRKGNLPLGRIRPVFLVGEGAREWGMENGIEVISDDELITTESKERWRNQMKLLTSNCEHEKSFESEMYDTVGAICLDQEGNLAAGVSSGGISLKHKGRVGEAAHYGSGCWAQNSNSTRNKAGIACSATGVGEQIMRSMLSYRCAQLWIQNDNADQTMRELFENDFLESSPTSVTLEQNKKLAGIIALRKEPFSNDLELVWAHTTSSMGLAYVSHTDNQPKAILSRMQNGITPSFPGKSVKIAGIKIPI